jgi:hypothetical protein
MGVVTKKSGWCKLMSNEMLCAGGYSSELMMQINSAANAAGHGSIYISSVALLGHCPSRVSHSRDTEAIRSANA